MAVAPSTRMVIYGHVGDGNVHFNPLRPADMTPEDYLARHGKRSRSLSMTPQWSVTDRFPRSMASAPPNETSCSTYVARLN
ncbi:hypothetical protein ACTMU2_13040 [Cupriavidus basilensis]